MSIKSGTLQYEPPAPADTWRHRRLRAVVDAEVERRDAIHAKLAKMHGAEYADKWTRFYAEGGEGFRP